MYIYIQGRCLQKQCFGTSTHKYVFVCVCVCKYICRGDTAESNVLARPYINVCVRVCVCVKTYRQYTYMYNTYMFMYTFTYIFMYTLNTYTGEMPQKAMF